MPTGADSSTGSGVSGSAPTGPSTGASGETAGTVTSFANGVLTITLADGSSVSGKVTEETEIHCQAAVPPAEGGGDQGDEHSGSEGAEADGIAHGQQHAQSGDNGQATGAGGEDEEGGQGSGDGEDAQGNGEGDGGQSCTTAALVPGAIVREAELSLDGSGAVWDHIDLIQ